MEIVIDIPEESYKATCDGCMLPPDVENVVQGIKNGTPLPKGHGRLIDAREVYKKFYCRCLAGVANEVLNETPTIIEADKENAAE